MSVYSSKQSKFQVCKKVDDNQADEQKLPPNKALEQYINIYLGDRSNLLDEFDLIY